LLCTANNKADNANITVGSLFKKGSVDMTNGAFESDLTLRVSVESCKNINPDKVKIKRIYLIFIATDGFNFNLRIFRES